MKTISVKDLVKIIADKLDLTYEADNFSEFSQWIAEIYPLFSDEFASIWEHIERYHNVHCAERCITIPTKALLSVYEEANAKFEISRGDPMFIDMENNPWPDQPYPTPYQITGETAWFSYIDISELSVSESLQYWQDVCKKYGCTATVYVGGNDIGEEYCNHSLEWMITGDRIDGTGSFFEIIDDNGMGLMDGLAWLFECFMYDSFEEFEKLGVELRYDIDPEAERQEFEMNGLLLCLQHKYGNRNGLFKTYEETRETVAKYPIVLPEIPIEFVDKQMLLTFFRANAEWMKRYRDMREAERQEDIEERKNNTVICRHKGRFSCLTNNAIVFEKIDFGEWMKDPEILLAACEGCDVVLSDASYEEETVIEVMKSQPRLMRKVYEYWKANIQKYPNTIERIRNTYELYNTPTQAELAFLKCLSMVGKDNERALIQLFTTANVDFDSPQSIDNQSVFARAFRALDPDTQNWLVSLYYYCAKYMKSGVLKPDLVEFIAQNCPIAGDILSDEAVLKYHLEPSETEQKAIEKCRKCDRCHWKHCRFD